MLDDNSYFLKVVASAGKLNNSPFVVHDSSNKLGQLKFFTTKHITKVLFSQCSLIVIIFFVIGRVSSL